jgi:ABC-type polysaccharide/polyol phosphate transport system ATPase subunit
MQDLPSGRSNAIIEVEHVTKEFRLGRQRSLKQSLGDLAARLRGKPVVTRAPFKALDDVSFTVEPGEVLGIIGHNGAGKSTLLKLLAGISKPTRGRVAVRGKVAPLIEVGAGLVPDLTGRENIYVNGAILGMKRAEIARKFDEIVGFAELEEFIDTPVKRYSSGMMVRLGFSIATSVEAEILIVDEVLAVGDLAFQRKCFERMEDLIRRQGRSVLLVSHNVRQVDRICGRCLLVEGGRLKLDAATRQVVDQFVRDTNAKALKEKRWQPPLARHSAYTGEIDLVGIELMSPSGRSVEEVPMGGTLTVRATLACHARVELPEVIIGFHTADFVYLISVGTAHLADRPAFEVGTVSISCRMDDFPLMPGVYGIRLSVVDRFRRDVFYSEGIKTFAVVAGEVASAKLSTVGFFHVPAVWNFSSGEPHESEREHSRKAVAVPNAPEGVRTASQQRSNVA